MNGAGNDIVVLDLRALPNTLDQPSAEAIAGHGATLCDQLMVLHPPRTPGTDAYIRIYNTDGSAAGACGNGMRCVTLVLSELTGRRHFDLETEAGVLACDIDTPASITVDMQRPKFAWNDIPLKEPVDDTRAVRLNLDPAAPDIKQTMLGELQTASVASMGNPHAIFWVDDIERFNLARVGPILERHQMFPERANITLATVVAPDCLRIATWERGAGLTKACGSAACAAAVSAARTQRTGRNICVQTPGGALSVAWREDDHVLMTGPAEHEHSGLVVIGGGGDDVD